jgi:hypothetical protein
MKCSHCRGLCRNVYISVTEKDGVEQRQYKCLPLQQYRKESDDCLLTVDELADFACLVAAIVGQREAYEKAIPSPDLQ